MKREKRTAARKPPRRATKRPVSGVGKSERIPTEFGTRVRRLRVGNRLSRVQLCRLSGVEPSTIYRIESGRTTKVTIDVASALARALGVTAGDLIDGKAA
jgi:ribosome-binding protein aMBF1 (putative translation factor)